MNFNTLALVSLFVVVIFAVTAECSKKTKKQSSGNQKPVVKIDKKVDIDVDAADVYANKTYQYADIDASIDKDYNVTGGKFGSYEVSYDANIDATVEKDGNNVDAAYEFDLTKQADVEALSGLLNATLFATYGRAEDIEFNKTNLEAAIIEVREYQKSFDFGKNNKTASGDILYERERAASKEIGKKSLKYFSEVGVLRDNTFTLDKNFYLNVTDYFDRTVTENLFVNKTDNKLSLSEDIEDSKSVKFGKDGVFEFDGSYNLKVNNATAEVEDLNLLKAFLLGTEAPLLKSMLLDLIDERIQ